MKAPGIATCATASSSDSTHGARPAFAKRAARDGVTRAVGKGLGGSRACLRFIESARRGGASAGAPGESFARRAGIASPACSEVTAGGFVARSYSHTAGSREYKLFVPAPRRTETLPLVLMLHGCGQTPDEFALATRMNALAEAMGFCVAYPAQPQTANPATCWNWFEASHQRRDGGEPALLAGLVNHLVQRHRIDDSRIYVAGLSAGGAMAVILGKLFPELFAAVGVHSGLPFGAAHDVRSAFAAMKGLHASRDCVETAPGFAATPTIVFHGDRDSVVHPSNGFAVAAATAGDCAVVESTTVPAGSGTPGPGVRRGYTCTRFRSGGAKVVAEHWLIRGGGHAWSGGDPRASCADPEGPDASRAMARFFLSHTLQPHPRERRPRFASQLAESALAAEAA